MFLVIGAIFLFALLVLNVNRTVLQSEGQQRSAEYIVMATSAAQNLMNEISNKSFDEGTLTLPVYSSDILTLATLLGPESGEVYGNSFDDIDDYNIFTSAKPNLRGGTFNLKVWVNYVNDNNFDVVMSTKTRTKRIKIAVENPFMTDTLYLYNYKSY